MKRQVVERAGLATGLFNLADEVAAGKMLEGGVMSMAGPPRGFTTTAAARLLTVKEAASCLGVDESTIRRLEKAGEIPSIRGRGLGVRFRQEDIESWIEVRRTRPLPRPSIAGLTMASQSPKKRSHGKTGGTGEMAKAKTKSRVKFDIGAVYTRKTKDGQNRWYLDYWDELGKRVQKLAANAQTVEDAEVALRTEVTKAFAKAQGIEEQKRIVFNDFAPTYLENYAKPNKRSWKCDDYCLEAHLKPYFGKFDMRDITPLEIEAYRAKRLKAGVKQSTTNREMALLKKMFHLAEDWGYCEKNPVMKVRLFSEKNNRRDRFLTDDEERRLLGHCRPHLVPIVIVALNTGMRLREVLRLRWDQIDADVKSVRVTRTKNGLDRTIPLNEAAYQAINAQREKSQGNYVFPSPKGKECMTSVSHSFARARRLAGIPDFHFHDTRHTFGTRLIRKGKDIITVQELMGHGSVTITQRYTHTGADRKREAVESLDQKPKNALRGCDTEVTEKSCVQATDSSTVN